MGAGAAVIAAAERPDAVRGLVLVGPFVRNPPGSALGHPDVPDRPHQAVGTGGLPRLLPEVDPRRPPRGVRRARRRRGRERRRPGHWKAFVATTRTTHAPAEARLDDVRAPAAVVMGTDDVDWKDPAAEARWVGERLDAAGGDGAGRGPLPAGAGTRAGRRRPRTAGRRRA